ncbi:MAG: D-2-hydroxyacid dehydrogenase [Pseudomonadota bacterium]|nr:D-2-hydroxyacid dehydrogenase [Pseudomonadota bacterium]
MRLVTHLPDANDVLWPVLSAEKGLEPVLAATPAEFCEAVAGADAVALYAGAYDATIARSVRAARDLRWIQTGSTGYDRLAEFGIPSGVRISTAGPLWAATVAEHAMALLLGIIRQSPMIEAQRQGGWNREEIRARLGVLEGARVAVVGFGAIGQAIAKRLRGFEVTVVAVTRDVARIPPQGRALAQEFVPARSLSKVLQTVDAVVLAVPLTAETRDLMDAAMFSAMKPGAVLVNIARGGVVDEEAMVAALRCGQLGGAGLDVFAAEPLPRSSALWSMPNVIVSPHVGGFGHPGRTRELARLIARNARNLMNGAPLENEVALPESMLTEVTA